MALGKQVRMKIFAAALAGLCLLNAAAALAAEAPLAVKVGIIRQPTPKQTLSFLDIPPDDESFAGAKLAAEDNNTTGKFTNQSYELVDAKITPAADPLAALEKLAADGIRLVIADVPADKLLKLADAGKARGILFFNAGAPDDSLREADCRANVFHSAPTRSMLADGLAQYLVWKKWRKWMLITGSHPEDILLGDAYRRAAKKFGAKIVEERTFVDTGGGRRSDSGSVQIQREIPVLTQSAPEYDVLIAADENEVFAGYLPFHTWDARLVAGSGGLKPVSWDITHEQWGAAQLQNRFIKMFARRMTGRDSQAWTAMRMIGEGASRTKSADPAAIRDFLRSKEFSVAAFKGQKLTMRDWNQQLRQPVLLGDGRLIVSVSPQEGFLHQVSELDTLGIDRPETTCKLQ